ncbi:hypothetical protein D3C76_600150 [compost metagenome]
MPVRHRDPCPPAGRKPPGAVPWAAATRGGRPGIRQRAGCARRRAAGGAAVRDEARRAGRDARSPAPVAGPQPSAARPRAGRAMHMPAAPGRRSPWAGRAAAGRAGSAALHRRHGHASARPLHRSPGRNHGRAGAGAQRARAPAPATAVADRGRHTRPACRCGRFRPSRRPRFPAYRPANRRDPGRCWSPPRHPHRSG